MYVFYCVITLTKRKITKKKLEKNYKRKVPYQMSKSNAQTHQTNVQRLLYS